MRQYWIREIYFDRYHFTRVSTERNAIIATPRADQATEKGLEKIFSPPINLKAPYTTSILNIKSNIANKHSLMGNGRRSCNSIILCSNFKSYSISVQSYAKSEESLVGVLPLTVILTNMTIFHFTPFK
jgi:hypothetical protein